MPSKIVNDLIQEVKELKEKLNNHLIQSGAIQTRLDFNTWLTGAVFVIVVGKLLAEFFKK